MGFDMNQSTVLCLIGLFGLTIWTLAIIGAVTLWGWML